jgi:flagellar motor switch protein FliN
MSSQTGEGAVPGGWGGQLMEAWTEAMASVLESMVGQRPAIRWQAAGAESARAGFAWWAQKVSLQEQPSFWLGAAPETWAGIGRMTLAALGVDDAGESDIESTYRDLMAQTTSMVATGIGRELGETVTGGDTAQCEQPEEADPVSFEWTMDDPAGALTGVVVWAASLLQRGDQLASAAAEAEQAPAAAPDMPDEIDGKPVNSLPRIDLAVSFVLGRTQLPLREIFKLNVGSVVELDRDASDAADVVIHGRVIARGQVVVVNGNYGLKILPRT